MISASLVYETHSGTFGIIICAANGADNILLGGFLRSLFALSVPDFRYGYSVEALAPWRTSSATRPAGSIDATEAVLQHIDRRVEGIVDLEATIRSQTSKQIRLAGAIGESAARSRRGGRASMATTTSVARSSARPSYRVKMTGQVDPEAASGLTGPRIGLQPPDAG